MNKTITRTTTTKDGVQTIQGTINLQCEVHVPIHREEVDHDVWSENLMIEMAKEKV